MQRWTVHLDGGPRRVNHAAVIIGCRIYSFGGYCTGENFEIVRPIDVHVLNTVSYRWNVLPLPVPGDPEYEEAPYHRYGHTAVAWSGRAYIFGGRNDRNGACNVLHCFDPITNKWSRPRVHGLVPGARDGHSACIINDRMFVFGGYEENASRFSNEVYALSFRTLTWSLLRVMSGKPARWRDFHSASGIGDKMYIFGGRSDRNGPQHTNSEIYCPKIQVFDTIQCAWHEPQTSGHAPCGRRSHSAFVYKDELFIIGGYNGIHDIHFDDLYKFTPADNRWSLVMTRGERPCARRRQCCCLVGERLFVFGGTRIVVLEQSNPALYTQLAVKSLIPLWSETNDAEYNLIDLDDLHVLDFAPTLKTLCMLTVLDRKLDERCLPQDLRWELNAMVTNSNINRTQNTSG